METEIESVSLTIRTTDGRQKAIELEVWQVEAIALLLGLQVKLPDIEHYTMSDKSVVKEKLERLIGKTGQTRCAESVENGYQTFTLYR